MADRSEGRLGYLHVPDMMAPGWAQLHRDLSRETARDGLILDVRGNGGGHTSQLVVEKLARKVIGWDAAAAPPAHAPTPTTRRAARWSRWPTSCPVRTATSSPRRSSGWASARWSGVRTWGGVIGIDSRYALVDGTGVTQPRYAAWFDDNGWGVENHGVDPDVEVVIRPQDWVAGRDPQLERAVDLAMAALAERPAVRPAGPGDPPVPGAPGAAAAATVITRHRVGSGPD